MKEIIKRAEDLALSEIKKYGLPFKDHFDIANKKGKELAALLRVDSDIVQIGTRLMDLKLGEAFSKGKPGEHLKIGSKTAKKFLLQFKLPKEVVGKIINCIEGHHGKGWKCKEAEIVANADCYRFLHPRGVFAYIKSLDKRFDNLNDALSQIEKKSEEKLKILSLDICKEELEPAYKAIKELIKKAKE